MPQIMRLDRDEPAQYELVILQGATFFKPLAFVQTVSPRVLLPITGAWDARLRVKDVYGGTLKLDMSKGNGRIVVGAQGTVPNDYNILLTLGASVTDALSDWGVGIYDLEVEDPFGKIYRWLEGPARLSRSVTR